MQTRPLGRTGLDVSIIGFGASPLGGVFGDVPSGEAARAVHRAIDLGINLFDVAPFYGLTRAESALGEALEPIPRDKYILATKVGRYGGANFDFSPGRIHRSIEESLTRLRTDHIDVITCHDIEFVNIDQVVDEALPALCLARDEGKVRFIGVSGLPLSIYHRVLDRAPLDTVLSYCHHTLIDNTLADHLPYLNDHGVGIINASPFSMGLLTGEDPPEWHPAGEEIRGACRSAAEYCKSRGVELPHLALRYAVASPAIATTLVGMGSLQQVEQNVAWLRTTSDPEILEQVLRILAPIHNRTWPSGLPENQ